MGSLIGTKVGHFRVMDLLGRGGMGEVYVGYDEKLERKVALKVIRAENRLDEESKARFLREARILSQLAHPNICQIFEYIEAAEADVLALELIEGTKLSAMVEKGLDHRGKLAVAINLAETLVAAHGKGIVHRDLKPDNVLVDHTGRVKVLDFGLSRSISDEERTQPPRANRPEDPAAPAETGVARETAPRPEREALEADPSSFRTQHGSILGTLGYMSPEQAHGEPATSASDIYSLGLVFQELFTGETAIAREGSFSERLERAKNAETHPAKGLDPDLAILLDRMKSRVPAARPTAVGTVDRLRSIKAKPAQKRRRLLVGATLIVLMAFSVGAGVQTFLIARERNRANQERDRANEEAARAREMLAFLTGTFEVANPRKGRGPSATAKEIIDHAAARLQGTRGQPLLQASLLMTLSEIYGEMGLYEAAGPLAERALQIREKLLGPGDSAVAASLNNLANIWRKQGKLTLAEPLIERSLEMRERESGADSLDVAQSLNDLAIIWWSRGKFADAEPLLRRSLKIREEGLGPNHPDVATSLNNLATLHADQGNPAQAEPLYKRSLAILETALGPNHPDVAAGLNNLATVYIDLGRFTEAEPLLQRSLEIRESTLGPDHPDVALSLNNIADLYADEGKLAEAEPLLRRSLEIKEKALGPDHPDVGLALYNLGVIAVKRGQRAEALLYMRRAIPGFVGTAYWKALVEEDPDIAALRSDPEFQSIVTAARRDGSAKHGADGE